MPYASIPIKAEPGQQAEGARHWGKATGTNLKNADWYYILVQFWAFLVNVEKGTVVQSKTAWYSVEYDKGGDPPFKLDSKGWDSVDNGKEPPPPTGHKVD